MKEGKKQPSNLYRFKYFHSRYAVGFWGEINLLLKCEVNPAHTQSSMGYQEGKFGSWAYELPGACDVFFT